jgi:hypothetical protein
MYDLYQDVQGNSFALPVQVQSTIQGGFEGSWRSSVEHRQIVTFGIKGVSIQSWFCCVTFLFQFA